MDRGVRAGRDRVEHVFVGRVVAEGDEPRVRAEARFHPGDSARLLRRARSDLDDLGAGQALELGVRFEPGVDDRGELDEEAGFSMRRKPSIMERGGPCLSLEDRGRVLLVQTAEIVYEGVDRALVEGERLVPG